MTNAAAPTATAPKRKRPELLLGAIALLVASAALLALGASSLRSPPAAGQAVVPQQPTIFAAANPFEEPPQDPPQPAGYIVYYTDPAGKVVAQATVPATYPQQLPPSAINPTASAPQATALPPQVAPQVPFAPQAIPTAGAPQANAAPQGPQYPVNLNTATQAQLETLPGIGPVKAQAVLAWRAANGGFSNPSQLLEIKGIGEKTLQKLLPYITI